ncbi:hypothetical protein I3843_Q039700 [Carya illinoinensis]|nr:hypothetical protein I3843_Q039700 [Carya illinoinensis]
MLSYLVVLLLLPLISFSADPDSLQDFCVADQSDTSNIFGSNVTGGNVLNFPALNTLGISMNRVDFAPGGVNPPHSHPRATESGVVIEGKLLVGFVTTGNVYHSKVLTAGQMFVIPRGLVHFQKNVGVGKALSSRLSTVSYQGLWSFPLLSLLQPSIPDDVLTRAFQVEEKVVESIKSKFSS